MKTIKVQQYHENSKGAKNQIAKWNQDFRSAWNQDYSEYKVISVRKVRKQPAITKNNPRKLFNIFLQKKKR